MALEGQRYVEFLLQKITEIEERLEMEYLRRPIGYSGQVERAKNTTFIASEKYDTFVTVSVLMEAVVGKGSQWGVFVNGEEVTETFQSEKILGEARQVIGFWVPAGQTWEVRDLAGAIRGIKSNYLIFEK